MTPLHDLEAILKAWQADALKAQSEDRTSGEHLSPETLYRLALPAGAKQPAPEKLQHLSLCPLCLREWAFWRQALSDAEESDDPPPFSMTYGLLKAAAAGKPQESIRMESACGRFCLSVLPQLKSAEEALVTLEVIADQSSRWNNRRAIVRDSQGQVLLEGLFQQGHLARRHQHLSAMDLSKWTVVVE
jgi:hypothetical protein